MPYVSRASAIPKVGDRVEGKFKTAPNANVNVFEGTVTLVYPGKGFMVRDDSGISFNVQMKHLIGRAK